MEPPRLLVRRLGFGEGPPTNLVSLSAEPAEDLMAGDGTTVDVGEHELEPGGQSLGAEARRRNALIE